MLGELGVLSWLCECVDAWMFVFVLPCWWIGKVSRVKPASNPMSSLNNELDRLRFVEKKQSISIYFLFIE